jgi:tRNA(Ile)-lysidine synthase
MLLSKVIETISRYSLFVKGDKLVIACSGGADSVSLLHLLNELKKDWNLGLVVGHYNHKLRKEADEDHSFVRKLASNYSLPFYSESGDVKAFANENRMNLEEAGRRLRYGFLKKIAEENGKAKIATGHTMTDQAETVLMRIIRGTGSLGLGGIQPRTEGGIVRPLLFVRRAEVLEYIEKKGLECRVDESNFNTDFLRNRIRHRLIPYLENNFSPSITDSLSRLALIIQEEDSFLKEVSRQKSALVGVWNKGQYWLDMDFLRTLPIAIQRRVVREYLSSVRGDLRGISYKDIHSVLHLERGKEFHLEKGLVFKNRSGLLGVQNESKDIKYIYRWTGDCPLKIRETDTTVKGQRIDEKMDSRDFNNRRRAFFDLSKLKFPLVVRNRLCGDRYRPLGSPGSQKIKEMMRVRRIPEADRERCPVFVSGDDIVWVQGLPVSEKYKVNNTTKTIFKIEIFPSK